MFNSLFKVVYFVEFVIIASVRKIFTAKYRKLDVVVDKKTVGDIIFLILNGIGMIIPLVYIFSSVLDFADYNFPDWIGWIGSVLFAFSICLLWMSHAELGRNWTPTIAVRSEHKLVTGGIFKYIRHPMYAAHILWAVAQIMLLHNWIAGYSFIIFVVPHFFSRVGIEEKLMTDQFGEEYRAYMKRTKRLIPFFY
jgi:protein-S-isoprenylcysteine O-methyltransferase Ste14